MTKIEFTLGLQPPQVEAFREDYRFVWSGKTKRITRPGLWRIELINGEIVVEIEDKKDE